MSIPQQFKKILNELDKKISQLNSKELLVEFKKIPLDIFGRIQIDRSKEYPNLLPLNMSFRRVRSLLE